MASGQERITQQRQQKLERIRERGVDPYPHRYHRSHTTQEAVTRLERNEAGLAVEAEVSVAGRITAHRDMGKFAFLDLRDGAGKIQLYFHKGHLDEAALNLLKDTKDFLPR